MHFILKCFIIYFNLQKSFNSYVIILYKETRITKTLTKNIILDYQTNPVPKHDGFFYKSDNKEPDAIFY